MIKVILVEWEDTSSYGEWSDVNKKFPTLKCRSVGLLLREDKKNLTIFQTQSTINQVTEVLVIPKAVIKKRKVLARI